MSADNWTVCPKCRKEAQDRTDRLIEMVNSSYGNLPQGEYDNLIVVLANRPAVGIYLAEYYELYIDSNNVFHAIYTAGCEKCGYSFSFNHEEPLDLGGFTK